MKDDCSIMSANNKSSGVIPTLMLDIDTPQWNGIE
jgi:hypothetical protein